MLLSIYNNVKEGSDMKNKLVWIIAAVVAIIALIVVATVLKQVNNSENAEDKDGYETYEVEKESPLKLEGKASPSSVKTYNYNSQIVTYISTQVSDGGFRKSRRPVNQL